MKLDRIASGDFFKSSGTYMEKMIPAQGSKSGGGLLSGGTDGSFPDVTPPPWDNSPYGHLVPRPDVTPPPWDNSQFVDGRIPEISSGVSSGWYNSQFVDGRIPSLHPSSVGSSGNNLDTSQFVDGRIPAISSGWSSSGNNLDTSQFVRTRNPLTDEEKQKIVQEAVNNWRPWWRSINPDLNEEELRETIEEWMGSGYGSAGNNLDTSQFVRTMTVDPDDELFATKRKWIQFADKDRKKYSPFFSKNHKVRKSIVG